MDDTFIVTNLVYQNLVSFIKNKSKTDNIFNLVTTSNVNAFLSKKMKKLTARVFRTYNSSKLYEAEILNTIKGHAIKINPTKGFSGNYKSSFDKLSFDKSSFNKSSFDKLSLSESTIIKIINDANIAVAVLCNHQKNVSKDNTIKLKEKIEKLKNKEKEKNKEKIEKNKEKIQSLKDKEKYNHLALGTSKLNYIDPRITVSILKQFNIPISVYFNKSQMEKFSWAIDYPNVINFIF